ncbi:MAG: glycosyltransferase family 4 protein [Candidatus Heimdallarchaeaceae archaeon]
MNGLTENGHECIAQCHNYAGQTLPNVTFEDGRKLNFKIMGTGMKPYSEDLLVPRIRKLKPDVFGVLLDSFMLFPWYLNYDYAPAKTLFYFPSDGEGGLPIHCEQILRKCNVPVAMSKFAQKQVWDLYQIKTEYIPHAIDTENYYPVSEEEKEKLKAKYGLSGKFVVGSVFRNQGRKMADRMIKAFAKFAPSHPDAVLFMHCDPFDASAVFDIQELIRRHKLQNRCVFSGMRFFHGFPYKQMNEIYNVMDVFFLSTSGEGFGVPTIEAMACKVPCVVTDYTTTKELLMDEGQCGIPVPICANLTGSWTVERGVMDIDKAAEALETLYNDKKLREKFGKVGRKKVLKFYNWKVVNKQWNSLINKMVEDG